MAENADHSRIVRFGIFEVDLRSGELRKNGIKIKLQDQPFRVLVILLRHTGEVVTRDEFRRELWPNDTFVDFDHGLNAAVRRLRDALDDSPDNPRFIETLPRHGYRFITTTAPKAIQPETPASPLWRWSAPVLVALFLTGLALLVWGRNNLRATGPFHTAEEPQIRSVAVLPFTNISGDPQHESFADGMTEALITELSRMGSLKVVSQTSMMQYKGEKKKALPQIGRELNVDAVLEGSALRVGNRVRIATHMIYVHTDQSLMSETYEGDLSDILKLQREAAKSISARVRVKLTPQQRSRLDAFPKVDPEAYQAYLTATHVDLSGQQGIQTSQRYFLKAIEIEPNFAEAYIKLAVTHMLLAAQRWQSPRQAFPSAKQAIQKALELDGGNCEAHIVLARVSWQYDWDWQTAEKEYQRALDLCPNNGGSHSEYGAYSAVNGRISEAQAAVAKSRELDAIRSEPYAGMSVIHYQVRDFNALTETSRAFVAHDPNNWLAHNWLGVGYEGSGQMLQAIREYQKAVELSQGDSDPTAALAHAYAISGRKAEAQKILRELVRQSQESYVSPYMIAAVYAGLRNQEKGFQYLEKAYQERSPDLSYFLRADLRMDSLRSDPRFQDLLKRINFPK